MTAMYDSRHALLPSPTMYLMPTHMHTSAQSCGTGRALQVVRPHDENDGPRCTTHPREDALCDALCLCNRHTGSLLHNSLRMRGLADLIAAGCSSHRPPGEPSFVCVAICKLIFPFIYH
jgi:hypothetical protein